MGVNLKALLCKLQGARERIEQVAAELGDNSVDAQAQITDAQAQIDECAGAIEDIATMLVEVSNNG